MGVQRAVAIACIVVFRDARQRIDHGAPRRAGKFRRETAVPLTAHGCEPVPWCAGSGAGIAVWPDEVLHAFLHPPEKAIHAGQFRVTAVFTGSFEWISL